MLEPQNYGGIIRSGQAIVPDFAADALRQRLAAIQEAQAGADVVRAQAQAAEQQREAAQEGEFREAMAQYQQQPSLAGLRSMMARFPQMSEALKRAHDAEADEVREGNFRAMAQVHGALRNNRADLALTQLRQRRDAGEQDPTLDMVIEALESGDPQRITEARQITRELLASMAGAERYAAVYGVDDPILRNVGPGEVVMDARSGRVAQSPIPQTMTTPAGVYEVPLMPGLPVIGGGVAPAVPAAPAVPGETAVAPPAATQARAPGNGISYRDPLYDQLEAPLEQQFGLPRGLLAAIRTRGERSNANAVSSAGARTVYQFTPETRAGFIRNHSIDPWASPENAARAAAIHLAEDYRRTGSWNLAIRRYHGGPNQRRWGPQNRAYAQRVGNFDRPNSGGMVQVRSRQQYERLASGTEYIAPDGTRRRKP